MKTLIRVRDVNPLDEYVCRVTFEDGTQKDIDLKPYLKGPIFEPIIGDLECFRSVQVIEGTVAWENGADIDPDVLYYDLKPSWMEERVAN
ncbi:MAG: DUF2442 domain-containing protein [Chloroflexota bacterium]|nr:DUF2442 domain-containing protein [Chloroflexota bacterium]